MGYEISGQSDHPNKNKLAGPADKDHPTNVDAQREAEDREDAIDGETNPDTLKGADQ